MKRIFVLGFLLFVACNRFITVDQGSKTEPIKPKGPILSTVNVGTLANDHTGDKLRNAFIKVNSAITQVNTNTANITLKAPINNSIFTGLSLFEQLKISAGGVTITAITSTGSDIIFWSGVTQLTAVPGIGAATWGTITGSLANQIDLQNALNAKGSGTLVAHDTTHLSDRINAKGPGTLVAHDTTHLSDRINLKANSSVLSGYVLTSTTVNGHALSGNISVTTTDLSLQNVTNESKATMFTNPTFTGVQKVSTTDTLATNAYARAHGGGISASQTAAQIHDSLTVNTEIGIALKDSASLLGNHRGNYMTLLHTITLLNDSLTGYRSTINGLQSQLTAILEVLGGFDLTPPLFVSAEIGDFADDTLLVLFDTTDVRQDSIPSVKAFNLTADATPVVIDTIAIGHDSLFLVLDAPAEYGLTYLLNYNAANARLYGHKKLQDSTGNKVINWVNKTVTNNIAPLVSSISVWGTGGATTINTNGGTLQMLKKTLPTNAGDTTCTWSVVAETGTANISGTGLMTALTNGTVEGRATANDGSAVYGQKQITISGQAVAPPACMSTNTQGWYISTDSIVKDVSDRMRRWGDYITSVGNDLTQGTAGNQPLWSADGVYFSNTRRDEIGKQSGIDIAQPVSIYMVVKIHEFVGSDMVAYFYPFGILLDPIPAGDFYITPIENSGASVDTWYIYSIIINGSGSSITRNAGTPATGTLATTNISMFRIGHNGMGASFWTKEIIIRSIDDTGANHTAILNYLNSKYTVY
jgi:hypothetical protein